MRNLYGGVDYRYSSADADKAEAIAIIANTLGISPRVEGLEYLLRLYSGGSGCHDRLAIRLEIQPSDRPDIYRKLRLRTLDEMLASPGGLECLEWLTDEQAPADEVVTAAQRFIDEERQSFQDACDTASVIAIADDSDMNTWCLVWEAGGRLNYLSFDQG